jgi:PAS domain S-box-containing protein
MVRRTRENASDAGMTAADMELPAHTVDGREKWVSVNAAFVRDEDGKVRNVVSVSRDITRRKLAEQALQASEQRYRSLVEHLPVTVYSTNAAEPTRPVYVSPRIESLLGYTPEQLTGDPDLGADRLHPDDRERVLAEHHHAAATGGKLLTEYRMIASDGRVVHVRQEGDVVPDDEGRPLYLHGYLQDITEQRRLEDQLRLAQKLESIGQLAAGIAHEINTPVQFVSDSVRFLQNGCGDLLELVDVYEELGRSPDPAAHARLEEAREYADLPYLRDRLPAAFERTVEGLKRVGDIVRAMREFAHPHRGGETPVDLNECLRNTLVVASAQYKYVADVETSYGDIPVIMADGGELNQVLVNLVVNAGHAIADVVRDTEGRGVIRVATRRDGGDVVVTVADSGTGISAEHRERIFDPFFTTKSVGQGTGQGLALVRTVICERHGGTIEVDSEPGNGTTFEIRLPITGAAPAGADAPTAAARA